MSIRDEAVYRAVEADRAAALFTRLLMETSRSRPEKTPVR
jgi:hypothetical protein